MTSKYLESCKLLHLFEDENQDILEKTLVKQYRKFSLLYHPDKNKSFNANEKFQEIHDAYEYLSKYLGYMDDDLEEEEKEVESLSFIDLINEFMDNQENLERVVDIYELLHENKKRFLIPDTLLILLSNKIVDSITNNCNKF
jgi:hypothetical protein